MKEIAVFMSTSETHNKKNVNKTIAETLVAFGDVVPPALAAGVAVRAYLSTVFGCPYEGEVDPDVAVELTERLRDMGVYQVSISDTIGVANPRQVEDVLGRVLAKNPVDVLAVHFHDTQGTALANCLVARTMGITTIDAAAGGLGGCPYAPGAAGNLATEDLIYMLNGLGAETGVSLPALSEASSFIGSRLDHPLPSRYAQAVAAKRA
jgi:hydroxymethylglutaryl-CoA lyase